MRWVGSGPQDAKAASILLLFSGISNAAIASSSAAEFLQVKDYTRAMELTKKVTFSLLKGKLGKLGRLGLHLLHLLTMYTEIWWPSSCISNPHRTMISSFLEEVEKNIVCGRRSFFL
jgi:hypothetical protein